MPLPDNGQRLGNQRSKVAAAVVFQQSWARRQRRARFARMANEQTEVMHDQQLSPQPQDEEGSAPSVYLEGVKPGRCAAQKGVADRRSSSKRRNQLGNQLSKAAAAVVFQQRWARRQPRVEFAKMADEQTEVDDQHPEPTQPQGGERNSSSIGIDLREDLPAEEGIPGASVGRRVDRGLGA